MKKILFFLLFILVIQNSFSQVFGNFPKIEKEKLHRDLDLLYQGLDEFHSGMYWYTPKDSVDLAFQKAKSEINSDLNVLEFHKIIAPLVGLTREDHTNIFLPSTVKNEISKNDSIQFLPITVVFLGDKLYCVKNASNRKARIETLEIEAINNETPREIVSKIGSLFASDGFIKDVKFNDLNGFNFSRYYYYYYGIVEQFQIKFKKISKPVLIQSLPITTINENLQTQKSESKLVINNELLEFKIMNLKTAYLGIHSFSNSDIKKASKYKTLKKFLENSFSELAEKNIENIIIDVSKNGGGTEGNEGLLYSYFGVNYQKYVKVRAKNQKVILDNGFDKTITLKAFGFLEKTFYNQKMSDGSYERKPARVEGLMAFKKEPKNKFKGTVYVIISPVTYSGASEFANMMFSKGLATFIGQETGGGYFGNTSGYGRELILPNSDITIDIPALQFVMNVEPKIPFGRGVIPHFKVIPTIEQFINKEDVSLEYTLKIIEEKGKQNNSN